MSKNKKRVEFRKNRAKPPRENDLTRDYRADAAKTEDAPSTERVRAKGDVSRYRTVVEDESAASDVGLIRGRVMRVHGLASVVEADDGRVFRCAVRRILKTLATDERSAVTTGDVVWFRPASGPSPVASSSEPPPSAPHPEVEDADEAEPQQLATGDGPLASLEGMIERVEPRHGVLTRASRRREHVLVANVDQLAIVISLVQPDLKPHLIDRYIASAIKGGLKPVLCLNKIDLADPVPLQPLVGAYAQLGVPTVLTSARTGAGIDLLRELLTGRATVFSGQSGVGKSSLLNAIQPDLALAVKSVSEVNQKGRHTTTYASLIKLNFGGWVVDTPGVRQLQLWDTRAEEVELYFAEFRPFVSLCGFPDCTHTHETKCAVKTAVERRQLSARRYHSYLGLFNGVEE